MLINTCDYSDNASAITLLWENPSPTTTFAAQTINLDLSGYEMMYVLHMAATDYQYLSITPLINDPDIGEQHIMSYAGTTISERGASVTDSGIVFTSGTYIKSSSSGTLSNGTGTGYAIPYRIYGRR